MVVKDMGACVKALCRLIVSTQNPTILERAASAIADFALSENFAELVGELDGISSLTKVLIGAKSNQLSVQVCFLSVLCFGGMGVLLIWSIVMKFCRVVDCAESLLMDCLWRKFVEWLIVMEVCWIVCRLQSVISNEIIPLSSQVLRAVANVCFEAKYEALSNPFLRTYAELTHPSKPLPIRREASRALRNCTAHRRHELGQLDLAQFVPTLTQGGDDMEVKANVTMVIANVFGAATMDMVPKKVCETVDAGLLAALLDCLRKGRSSSFLSPFLSPFLSLLFSFLSSFLSSFSSFSLLFSSFLFFLFFFSGWFGLLTEGEVLLYFSFLLRLWFFRLFLNFFF
jgi:hypothetical protein